MKNIKKYLIILSVSVILMTPSFSLAVTIEELQAQIAALLAQIQQLQAQLAQMQGTTQWCHDFNTNLGVGSGGNEVIALVTALNKEGFSVSGSIFNEEVASAVTGFQEKYKSEILIPLGLKYGTGYVGKSTRAKLNLLYGCNELDCIQVVTPAKNIQTGECKEFPTPCDVPSGWTKLLDIGCPYPPPTFVCTDTDGGINFNVKGTVTAGGVTRTDVCAGCTGTSCALDIPCGFVCDGVIEYYCDGNTIKSIGQACPAGTSYCSDGACKSITPTSSITVLSPNGGESWKIGQTYQIKWKSMGGNNIQIGIIDTRYSSEAGARAEQTIANLPNASDLEHYNWTIPSYIGTMNLADTASAVYKIKIYLDGGVPGKMDQSDAPFIIAL